MMELSHKGAVSLTSKSLVGDTVRIRFATKISSEDIDSIELLCGLKFSKYENNEYVFQKLSNSEDDKSPISKLLSNKYSVLTVRTKKMSLTEAGSWVETVESVVSSATKIVNIGGKLVKQVVQKIKVEYIRHDIHKVTKPDGTVEEYESTTTIKVSYRTEISDLC